MIDRGEVQGEQVICPECVEVKCGGVAGSCPAGGATSSAAEPEPATDGRRFDHHGAERHQNGGKRRGLNQLLGSRGLPVLGHGLPLVLFFAVVRVLCRCKRRTLWLDVASHPPASSRTASRISRPVSTTLRRIFRAGIFRKSPWAATFVCFVALIPG